MRLELMWSRGPSQILLPDHGKNRAGCARTFTLLPFYENFVPSPRHTFTILIAARRIFTVPRDYACETEVRARVRDSAPLASGTWLVGEQRVPSRSVTVLGRRTVGASTELACWEQRHPLLTLDSRTFHFGTSSTARWVQTP